MRLVATIAKAGAALLIVIAVVLTSTWFLSSSLVPSDSQVVARFKRDKASLEQLRQTFSHEASGIDGVTQDSVIVGENKSSVTPSQAGFTEQKFADYQRLLAQAHVDQVLNYGDETDFYFTSAGMAGTGWRLFFVYRTSMPGFEAQTIDPPHTERPPFFLYRPLGGNWYVRLLVF
jgi:hypothetical protein